MTIRTARRANRVKEIAKSSHLCCSRSLVAGALLAAGSFLVTACNGVLTVGLSTRPHISLPEHHNSSPASRLRGSQRRSSLLSEASMQDAACRLRRTPLLGIWVNKVRRCAV